MKKIHIILIVAIAAIMGLMVVSLMGESRTYASFEEAAENPEKSYDIIGTLDTTRAIVYDAKVNAERFSFYMYDQDKKLQKVVVNQPKPQDFERSAQVVASGKSVNGEFVASGVLLKCPSKYESEAGKKAQIEVKNL
jgi:cytochrome c-type biogenesis protein CcmE